MPNSYVEEAGVTPGKPQIKICQDLWDTTQVVYFAHDFLVCCIICIASECFWNLQEIW
jgi:hypothetical protein